jgi:hypothetical protein
MRVCCHSPPTPISHIETQNQFIAIFYHYTKQSFFIAIGIRNHLFDRALPESGSFRFVSGKERTVEHLFIDRGHGRQYLGI